MNKPTCNMCVYFHPEESLSHEATYHDGRCRRHTPAGVYKWPLVAVSMWCGEWTNERGVSFMQIVQSSKRGNDEN